MLNTNSIYAQKTKLRELVFPAYFNGQIDRNSAVTRLRISERQFIRLQNKYKLDKNLQHKLCNQPSNHSFDPETKATILGCCKTSYRGWNYEHTHDSLLWRNDISVSSDTIRNWSLAAKLSLPKQRKPRKYMHREPKPQFGEMLQLDGTFGDFLGDGRMLCLMHLVDDATKTSLAMLFEAECTASAMQLFYHWCLKYGIPQSIYSDRHGTYKVNEKKLTLEEEVEGTEIRLSEFGKTCERLGVRQIFARSPQGKGRVERKHNLYKDRCVKEFKLDGIKTIDTANVYLAENNGFVTRLNNKFTIEAREARTACVLPTPADLAEQFTIQNIRTVRNDYTVQLHTVVYQLPRNTVVNARAKVVIKQYLDGSIAIFAGNNKLKYTIIEHYVKLVKDDKTYVIKNQIAKYVPPIDHPYRQKYKPETIYRYQTSSKQLQNLGDLYG
jgi:hypothetical protein